VVRAAPELPSVVPAWLQADHDGLTAKVLRAANAAFVTGTGDALRTWRQP